MLITGGDNADFLVVEVFLTANVMGISEHLDTTHSAAQHQKFTILINIKRQPIK